MFWFVFFKKKFWTSARQQFQNGVHRDIYYYISLTTQSRSLASFRFVDIFPIVEEQKTNLIRQQHIGDISAPSVTISFFFHFVSSIGFVSCSIYTLFRLLVSFRFQLYFPDSFYLRCQLQFSVFHPNFILVHVSPQHFVVNLNSWVRFRSHC